MHACMILFDRAGGVAGGPTWHFKGGVAQINDTCRKHSSEQRDEGPRYYNVLLDSISM